MSATSTFSDPTGRYTGMADLMNRNAVAGFQMWAPHLGDNGANIEISFYLVTNYANRGGGSSMATAWVGEHQGLRVYDQGSAYELRTGHDVNGTQPDLRVFFDVDFMSQYYWINPLDGTPAPADRTDLVQVIAHEIGHALGFNGGRDWATYTPRGGDISRFDTFVTTSGGKPYFTGASAVAVYGGPVPLTAGNLYHLGNAGGPEALIADLMNGVVMRTGAPYSVSDLDLAVLSDSGVPTRLSDTLQGSAHGDTMAGGAGDDRIAGEGGNDVLMGDAGADLLDGGPGSDDLRGGAGADIFFTDGSAGAGVDVVRDFSAEQGDRVQVGGGAYRVYASGSSTVVDFDNGAKVVLENVGALDARAVIGGPQPPPPSEGGQVIRADQVGDTLAGGSGADTLYASQGPDQLTGGGGADHFAFEALPWRAGVVTDFADRSDRIDLTALYQASGYRGSDAVADRYVSFESDGAGGTKVMYDTDGAGTAQAWSFHIVTLQAVAPAALSNADLVGGSAGGGGNETQPGSKPGAGQVLTASKPGDTLAGGAGNDTLNASQGPDQLTGAGGADRFVFAKPPWSAGVITDFAAGADKIDVSAPLDAYTGSNPIADGWLRLDAANGSTKVYVDIDGAGGEWPFLITTLQGVPPSSVSLSDFVV